MVWLSAGCVDGLFSAADIVQVRRFPPVFTLSRSDSSLSHDVPRPAVCGNLIRLVQFVLASCSAQPQAWPATFDHGWLWLGATLPGAFESTADVYTPTWKLHRRLRQA